MIWLNHCLKKQFSVVVVCTSRQAHITRRRTRYYFSIQTLEQIFVAFRFSRRRFRHQMVHPLVLMWKQMLAPPLPHDLLFENMASIYTYRNVNSSILKWPSLDYLSTNCTLTWGFSHCGLLIYSGMKSGRFQLREKRDWHASSKWKQSTVLYRAVTSLVFCMLLVFVKYAHWPLTYFSPHRPLKGHRD